MTGKGKCLQWDLNLMPLICQTSALTARPLRLSCQITHPSDTKVSTAVAINIYIVPSAHPFHADVLQLCICSMPLLDGPPSSKY